MITPRALGRQLRTTPLPRRPALALPRWWRRFSPLHLIWLTLWAPWWVGNELPPPPQPRSREPEMAEQPAGTAGAWLLESLDALKLRFGLSWAAALLIRGAWLGGVAGIGWIAVAALTGAPSPTLTQLGVLVAAGAALGLVLWVFHRPRYLGIALLLERAFLLRSRLSTAVLALRFDADAPGGLHELQLADAANALARTRADLRPVHWVPVREIFIAFIIALALLLALLARRPEGEIPPAAAGNLPPFVPVSERLAAQVQAAPEIEPDTATLQEVEDLSRRSNQARQDLEAVGEALDGTTQTQPASEAIAAEDYPGANERLTSAAPAVHQLPAAERDVLADRLEQAAGQVSDDNAALADSARRAASEVRSGEDAGALDELGDRIETTGEDVIPQEAEGGELRSTSSEQAPGESGASGGSSAEQPQQPESGSQSGEPGEAGDPGAGMTASGGTGESGEGSAASGEGAEGDRAADAGGSGEVSEGEAAGQQGDGSQGSGQPSADPSEQEGQSGGAGSEDGDTSADQGGGASSGNRESSEEGDGDGGSPSEADDGDESGAGEAADDPEAGDLGEEGDGPAAAAGGAAITLPGTSGERVSTGSDIGASSVGSGGGVGAAAGDATTGVSGDAGPDPNIVPVQWRDLVERYFREGGAP